MEVEEIVFRADLKVLIVVAFLMCSEVSPRQKDQSKKKSTITFCLALIEWNFEEGGVGTGAKNTYV